VASYWNIAFYPEWCSNVELDDTETYNTVVRVSGAWAGIADALKQVLDNYGWHRTVFLSNEAPGACYFGGVPIKKLLSTAANFSFYWIDMAPVPTDEEIEDYLHQIHIRTRGHFTPGLSFVVDQAPVVIDPVVMELGQPTGISQLDFNDR